MPQKAVSPRTNDKDTQSHSVTPVSAFEKIAIGEILSAIRTDLELAVLDICQGGKAPIAKCLACESAPIKDRHDQLQFLRLKTHVREASL